MCGVLLKKIFGVEILYQYLFYIGDFPIRSYGVILSCSIILAVGVGYFESVEDAAKMIELDKTFESQGVDYSECYERYQEYDKILNVVK